MRISPENFWREVWHDDCARTDGMIGNGIMKRLPETLTIEDGSVLRGYECLHCGERCYAGLNAERYVTVRPFAPGGAEQPRGRTDVSAASDSINRLGPKDAEQWFPGKHIEGVQEIAHDPGDGSTVSNGYGYLGSVRVNPGDWIVTDQDDSKCVVRQDGSVAPGAAEPG